MNGATQRKLIVAQKPALSFLPVVKKLLPGYIKIALYFNLRGLLVLSKTGTSFGASRNNLCLSTAIEISFQGLRQH